MFSRPSLIDGRKAIELDESRLDSQADSVLTITDLIRAKLDTGKSVRDLARDSGDRVKHQTFDDYSRRAPKSWPKETKTISGMAAALGVTETSIVLAYAASLGVDVAVDSMLAQQLPAATVHLTPQLRNAIVALINAAAAATTEGATNEDTSTQDTPGDPQADGKAGTRGTPNTRAGNAGADKPDALISGDQGSRDDYDLARRTGITEYEWRMANEPQPENENQDTGTNDPA